MLVEVNQPTRHFPWMIMLAKLLGKLDQAKWPQPHAFGLREIPRQDPQVRAQRRQGCQLITLFLRLRLSESGSSELDVANHGLLESDAPRHVSDHNRSTQYLE